ncbi:hypothetical protein [Pedobacter sp. B4-66]|uniref:hypothetical protein n=1 Tax=Pedobacter sp. B4-66 TaxID=2817280 RepID=UPI001BDA0373|nr:hypothetical protein [Pedobacter sp. B4-66]
MNFVKTCFIYICFLALMTCSINTSAQDVQNLDLVEGISIFKFGTDTNKIKDLEAVANANLKSKNIALYRYTGDSLRTFFNVPVNEVLLHYYKNKLFRVDVNFGTNNKEYTLQEYSQVHQELEKTYGTDKVKLAMSGAVILGGFRWSGKKIHISHTRHSYPPKRKKDNGIFGEVTFSDNSIQKQSVLDKS